MHQVFLQRVASHLVLRKNYGFRVFLEYDQDLSVRTKNAKERVGLHALFLSSTESLIIFTYSSVQLLFSLTVNASYVEWRTVIRF